MQTFKSFSEEKLIMNHEQSVKFKKDYLDFLKRSRLTFNDVKVGGDILERCRAQKLIDNRGVKPDWMGVCTEPNSDSTFDISLIVDSLSGDFEPDLMTYKLRKAKEVYPTVADNVYIIPPFEDVGRFVGHSCRESAFNIIKRWGLGCHHYWAGRGFIERCLPLLSYKNKKIRRTLKTFTSYVHVPKPVIELFDATEDLPAIERRDLLLNYVRKLRKGKAHKFSDNQIILDYYT